MEQKFILQGFQNKQFRRPTMCQINKYSGGAGGPQPLERWKNLQKSAFIGQKIGCMSGKIFINNSFYRAALLSFSSSYAHGQKFDM